MITVRANARNATYISDDLITSGSVGIPVTFVLSEDFNGLSAIAVFEGSSTARDVALMGDSCVVPHEVLATAGGYLRIGIYASNADGTIVIPTVWAGSKLILQGTEPSEVDPSEPTPSWAAQVQEAAAEALANSEEAIEIAGGAEAAAEEARESASAAATSATDAGQFASAAGTAQTAAEAAQTVAASARDAAVAAQGSAENNAQAAAGSATAAAGSAAAAAASEAAAREVQESIPVDYTALSEDVSELKSHSPSVATPEETEADLYICDSNGNVIAKYQDGHIITKNFDSRAIQLDLIMEADSDEADLYIADSFGNVVAEFKDGGIVTKNFDSSDYVDVLTNISALQTDVTALQSATSGILYRNMDATDGVYAACRWHQPNASAKQFCLLMGADVHGDAVRTANMVEYLNAVDAFDAGIMLGDIGAWESDATWYTQAISNTNKPFLTVVGNHDAAGNMSVDATSYEYVHDFYEKFIAPNLPYADLTTGEHESDNVYYFKDFPAHKIRIICVNQYDYPPDKVGDTFVYKRGENCYSQAQITWLCNTLASTPTDYAVIMAMHSFPESMSTDMSNPWVSSTWFGASGSPADIMDHANDGYIIPQIVQAWIDGTSLQKTFHYQPSGSWTECVVNVDFSSRGTGEFVTYIGGHWHMSVLGKCYHYHDQKMYCVDASGLNAATQGDTPRRAGTRSEDAICVLAVDRNLKKVKLFRIGAHFTKDAIDRLYGEYSYDAE